MKKKQFKFICFFVLVLCLGIGFAVLSSNLSLVNRIKLSQNTFKVQLNRPEVIDTSLENPTYSIDNEKLQVSFNASLDSPGDFVEYGFLLENVGTLDASLESFSISEINSDYLNYSLTYYDGTSLEEGDLIDALSNRRVKFRLEYKYDINDFIDLSDLSVTITFKYIQPKTSNEKIWDYDYEKEIQTFVAKKTGDYKIETWGAQGGTGTSSDVTSDHGYGGYSVGTVSLTENEKLYISVGQAGSGLGGVDLPMTYNGGGGTPASTRLGLSSSGGGGTFVFDSNSAEYTTGEALYNTNGDGNGNPVTSDQVYMSGDTLVINYPDNYNFYRGGNSKKRQVGDFYKIEYRGENLNDPRIEYAGGIYPVSSTYFFPDRGLTLYAKNISYDTAEIYYEMTEENKTTEFRLLTHGAFVKIHSKTVIKLNDPLIVSGGGGGAHIHANGKSYGGNGGGYKGTSPMNIYQHPQYGVNCSPGTGGTQTEGGQLGKGDTASGSNGNRGVGGSSKETSYGSGGGGGYFGGASGLSAYACSYSASGGSGYIANSRLKNKAMYCYDCDTSDDPDTKTITTKNVSATPKSEYAKIGNGHVRITYLG